MRRISPATGGSRHRAHEEVDRCTAFPREDIVHKNHMQALEKHTSTFIEQALSVVLGLFDGALTGSIYTAADPCLARTRDHAHSHRQGNAHAARRPRIG